MGGVELRAARLFNKESGRAFITAFDHGSTVGPRAGSEAAALAAPSAAKAAELSRAPATSNPNPNRWPFMTLAPGK